MSTSVAAWERLGTATIADALDRHGLAGCVMGVGGLAAGASCCGPAFTVRYVPARSAGEASVGDFLDDVPAGSVVVIDNGGRVDCTVWGAIMSRVALARGVGGAVVDGACRDVAEARALRFPLFARAPFMRTGKERVRLQAVGEPIALGGVCVAPGDLVRGDADGVVAIPAGRAPDLLADAQQIADAEARIVHAVGQGATLRAARAQQGYHRLQCGAEHG